MKYLIFIIILIPFYNTNAQIDTSVWYPLHIGDKWEYYGQGFGYSQVEIIGDTLMPNGNTYYMFSNGVYAWRFQRYQSNKVYYYFAGNNEEFLLFDFEAKDKTLWGEDDSYYWGLFETNDDNENLLDQRLEYKIFDVAFVDTILNPPDTVWGYLIDAYPTRVTKGFGISSYVYNLETLVGAVINGVGYGTLVDIEEKTDIADDFILFQNYPNPFNPSTTIKYKLPMETHVSISVYNTLGEKVKTLYEGRKRGGAHNIILDGSDLPSGAYFIQMISENIKKTIKALLIK